MHEWENCCNSSVNYSLFKPWIYIQHLSLVFCLFVHIVNELLWDSILNNWPGHLNQVVWRSSHVAGDLASFCTLIVADTKPPEGSVGVSCGCRLRRQSGEWCENCQVKWWWREWPQIAPLGRYFSTLPMVFIFSSGFYLDSREYALLDLDEGASGCTALVPH